MKKKEMLSAILVAVVVILVATVIMMVAVKQKQEEPNGAAAGVAMEKNQPPSTPIDTEFMTIPATVASETMMETTKGGEEQFKYLPDTPVVETFDLGGGYKVRVKLYCGPWIRANDKETLDKAWESLQSNAKYERVPIEYFDKAAGHSYSVGFTEQEGLMAFCQIEMENISGEGFSFSEEFSKVAEIPLAINPYELESKDYANMGLGLVDYSSERVLLGLANERLWGLGSNSIIAKMTADSWGPANITLAIPNVYNPEHPDGIDIEKMSFYLGLGLKGATEKPFRMPMYEP